MTPRSASSCRTCATCRRSSTRALPMPKPGSSTRPSCSACAWRPTCTIWRNRSARPAAMPRSPRPCWPTASRSRGEPVALPVLEHDMAGLQARIATSIEFIESLPRAEIDAAAERNVFFRLKNGTELPFTGRTLLLTFSVPQFFFHVTTAYDLLRHAGVELVKKDYLGRK